MDQEKIGRFLGQVRREQGLTQEQLAQRLGVSQRTVSRWETGRNMPDISMLTALCAQLDITVAEMLAGQRMEGETVPKTEVSDLAEQLIPAASGRTGGAGGHAGLHGGALSIRVLRGRVLHGGVGDGHRRMV